MILIKSPLLQQQLPLAVEYKNREGTMQRSGFMGCHFIHCADSLANGVYNHYTFFQFFLF
jgi:hypothetical protein